ncbi:MULTISPECIES: DNA adenine methylase [Trichocoleus]|uniref:Site-specific DNA-methyltransferase (adenine-specific) n=1 Tax=Trichocoleus desertorum GB2-A4 TaxID=2933944 RepID=A0ABV0JGD0_9CYAN|nr:DNA adenine methylase [Trichocoleus sp. FACHB-46]MBD1862698.1 DNA adenine methylase [Trichocoleus sp. FACHB-46]
MIFDPNDVVSLPPSDETSYISSNSQKLYSPSPENRTDNRLSCKPFLKWAGGKTQLLPELGKRIPSNFDRYFEPFIGGGAFFFKLQPKIAYISDINSELINCYKVVKYKVQELAEDLLNHIYDEEYYYALRNADQELEFSEWSDIKRASRFIYLNKTCFNGLYRVNSKGFFNVPFGRYKNPRIFDEKNLLACSKALRNTQIELSTFTGLKNEVKKGDFIYFDPPYAPISSTSDFTKYTLNGFGEEMQKELASFCTQLDKKRIKFMVSNSHTSLILDLYKSFNIDVIEATRLINSKAEKRGKIKEVIITNY